MLSVLYKTKLYKYTISVLYIGCLLISIFVCVWGQQCPYDDIEEGCFDGPSNFPKGRVAGFQVDFIDNTLYPYMVSLQERQEDGICYKHFCGGTMIAPNLALTAAHCMDDVKEIQPNPSFSDQVIYSPKSANYFVAISPRCRHLVNEAYGRMAIDEIYFHPNYSISRGALHNDVAIVQLLGNGGKFYEGPLVQLVDNSTQVNQIQKRLKTMGYGQAKIEPDPQNPKYTVYPLHGGNLSYLEYEMCRNILLDRKDDISANELDYDTMICLYDPQADTCNGDSGGPLLDGDVQIGIVSWGPGSSCQARNAAQAPAIFVPLPKYVTWINSIVQRYGCFELGLCQASKSLKKTSEILWQSSLCVRKT